MAAEIYDALDIKPSLIEGHDKIFQVSVGGRVLYTNERVCGQLPKIDYIVNRLKKL